MRVRRELPTMVRLFPYRAISEATTSAEQQPAVRRHELTWEMLAPGLHPFRLDDEERARLVTRVEALVPEGVAWSWPDRHWEERHRCVERITDLFVDRYGPWAREWNWSVGEGDKDGGPVGSWCCGSHSVRAPRETASRAVAALLEWRAWLEGLEAVFAELAPAPDATPEQRSWHLERAAVRLVTRVLDSSGGESGWYGGCYLALEWFLTSCGMDRATAGAAVREAIGGRFESWVAPSRTLIDSVGEDLAVRLTGRMPYRDHREYEGLEERHDRGPRERG
ncbi:hypothetical protein ACGFYA_34820 [Streptomyces sp. NPDC048305]|uniref:hypothetical protein n=1 Tax=Streptomyces sp. NPDC048305 TaxID=3365532 RepID=UPI003723AAA0